MEKSSLTPHLDHLREIFKASFRVWNEQGPAAFSTQILEKLSRHEFRLLGHSVPDVQYQAWIKKTDPDTTELVRQRTEGRQLSHRPMISLVTPVWNPQANVLQAAVSSVLAQTYENWELCVACGNSNDEVGKTFSEIRDPRIKLLHLRENLGICENSNAAIRIANGELIGFLDQDDLLAPQALFEVARCLNKLPRLDFIYSDMDRIDSLGKRFDPLFKPDWSPEILLCTNYIVHLAVIRTDLLKAMGGFRPGTDRVQDWDLVLRLTETTTRIFHIPRVLYHWRWSPISASSAGFRLKSVSEENQHRVLTEFLTRNNIHASAKKDRAGSWRVVWNNPALPRASIIIYDHYDYTSLCRCTNSILAKTKYPKFEVIALVTDKSGTGRTPTLDKRVTVIQPGKTLTPARAYNLGVKQSAGEVLVFIDAHIEAITSNWLRELVGWASRASIGVVGPKLMFPDSKHIVHCGIVLGLPNFLFYGAPNTAWSPIGLSEWYRNCSAVSGTCLTTTRSVFDKIGGFSEDLHSAADIDYCLRAQHAGDRVVLTPVAKLILHKPSNHIPDQTVLRVSRELGGLNDPYYNPNLSYSYPIPRLSN